MKNLITLILLITIIGCATTKQQRRENKVVKKIEKLKVKYPDAFTDVTTETVRIDTVLQPFAVKGETEYDTVAVIEYLDRYLPSHINKELFIQDFLNVARDTLLFDSLGIHLKIDGVGVNFSLTKDEQHITAEKAVETITLTKTEVVNKVPWWIWVIVSLLGISLVLVIIKK